MLILANWPYTLLGIMPANNKLKAIANQAAGPRSALLLRCGADCTQFELRSASPPCWPIYGSKLIRIGPDTRWFKKLDRIPEGQWSPFVSIPAQSIHQAGDLLAVFRTTDCVRNWIPG